MCHLIFFSLLQESVQLTVLTVYFFFFAFFWVTLFNRFIYTDGEMSAKKFNIHYTFFYSISFQNGLNKKRRNNALSLPPLQKAEAYFRVLNKYIRIPSLYAIE